MLIEACRLGQERVDCASYSSASAFTERGWNRKREEPAGSTEADVEDCCRLRGEFEQSYIQMSRCRPKPSRKVHLHLSLCRRSIRSRSTSPLTARPIQGECMHVFWKALWHAFPPKSIFRCLLVSQCGNFAGKRRTEVLAIVLVC